MFSSGQHTSLLLINVDNEYCELLLLEYIIVPHFFRMNSKLLNTVHRALCVLGARLPLQSPLSSPAGLSYSQDTTWLSSSPGQSMHRHSAWNITCHIPTSASLLITVRVVRLWAKQDLHGFFHVTLQQPMSTLTIPINQRRKPRLHECKSPTQAHTVTQR